jgi:hypothetical protein
MKNSTKNRLYITIAVLAIASMAYRIIGYNKGTWGYEFSTSLMFVALPALIAILLVRYMKKPKGLYSAVFRVVTLFLILSSVLLGEGTICVIMAAPIFYGVSFFIVLILESLNKKGNKKLNSLILIPVLFLLIQPSQFYSDQVLETVSNTRVVSPDFNLGYLNQSVNLDSNLSFVLNMGFPKPVSVEGNGTEVGDFRKIKFESTTKGVGTLHLGIVESTEERIVFDVISDDTHIGSWISWKEVVVGLTKNEKGQKVLTWDSSHSINLGPKWYFNYIVAYVVNESNEHLIQAFL